MELTIQVFLAHISQHQQEDDRETDVCLKSMSDRDKLQDTNSTTQVQKVSEDCRFKEERQETISLQFFLQV
jgi:hypothetical protein